MAAILVGSLAADAIEPPDIDRQALVTRHNIALEGPQKKALLQTGNGEFAVGVDVTGLQTTAGQTMSQWGWHTAPPLPGKNAPADLVLEPYDTHGRPVGYPTNPKGQEKLYTWLRENPHRLNLGRFRLLLDGRPLDPGKLTDLRQNLDLWRGLVETRYSLDGEPVAVETCCHPDRDLVGFAIRSKALASGRLAVEIAFPYGDPGVSGAAWAQPGAHASVLRPLAKNAAVIERRLDQDRYQVTIAWQGTETVRETAPHTFLLTPRPGTAVLEWCAAFAPQADARPLPDFAAVRAASARHWPKFWQSGGAIDLSASKDPRWRELERRIVLSQYLLAVNEAGSLPPQESGLFNNSGWYGKFHLEMHWWHGAHYALWSRWSLLDKSLGWYFRTLPEARALAASQGYRGARWPKMVGPEGRDSPSGVGPLLIWQQPHPLFYAELDYRRQPTRETLEKWHEVVTATADFLASYAVRDAVSGQWVLGPPLKTVPEKNDPRTTRNPAFELSYWRFGLRTAVEWRKRLGLPPEKTWQEVLDGLAPLPVADGCYLQQEGLLDTYTKWNWEHPSLIGTRGMLPGDGVDPAVMKRTVQKVMTTWQWDRCWGWDFPMMAMAAARNGEPAMAIDALLHPSGKNGFDVAGLSTGGPYPYFPSNGGLLYAVAMMAAGWDGAPAKEAPGFPADGSWTVRWEGLKKAP